MVKHMALVENSWFVCNWQGADRGEPWTSVDWDADPDWDFHSAADDEPEQLLALYTTAIERSRAAIAGSHDLSATAESRLPPRPTPSTTHELPGRTSPIRAPLGTTPTQHSGMAESRMPCGTWMGTLGAPRCRAWRVVGSGQSALSTFRPVGFSGPPSEPDVRLSPHPALHEPMRQTSGVVCLQLVSIPSTLASASISVGDGASVFTGDLLAFQPTCCGFAALLGHVVGFPDRRLLRGLRPNPGSSVDDGPARRRPHWAAGRATPRWLPR